MITSRHIRPNSFWGLTKQVGPWRTTTVDLTHEANGYDSPHNQIQEVRPYQQDGSAAPDYSVPAILEPARIEDFRGVGLQRGRTGKGLGERLATLFKDLQDERAPQFPIKAVPPEAERAGGDDDSDDDDISTDDDFQSALGDPEESPGLGLSDIFKNIFGSFGGGSSGAIPNPTNVPPMTELDASRSDNKDGIVPKTPNLKDPRNKGKGKQIVGPSLRDLEPGPSVVQSPQEFRRSSTATAVDGGDVGHAMAGRPDEFFTRADIARGRAITILDPDFLRGSGLVGPSGNLRANVRTPGELPATEGEVLDARIAEGIAERNLEQERRLSVSSTATLGAPRNVLPGRRRRRRLSDVGLGGRPTQIRRTQSVGAGVLGRFRARQRDARDLAREQRSTRSRGQLPFGPTRDPDREPTFTLQGPSRGRAANAAEQRRVGTRNRGVTRTNRPGGAGDEGASFTGPRGRR